MDRTAFNPSEQPLVVDDEGRVIEGRGWGHIDTTGERAKRFLETGQLVLVEEPKGGADRNSPAAEAFDRTRDVASRKGSLARLDVDQLEQIAEDAGVELPDGAKKQDWVAALAGRTDLAIPAKVTPKKDDDDDARPAPGDGGGGRTR